METTIRPHVGHFAYLTHEAATKSQRDTALLQGAEKNTPENAWQSQAAIMVFCQGALQCVTLTLTPFTMWLGQRQRIPDTITRGPMQTWLL